MGSTGFIGRVAELRDIAALVASSALVTIVGPGGVGKTRLALETAQHTGGRFSDGVHLVDLALVRPNDFDQATIPAQLGHRSLEALIESLAGSSQLVILDNCEHVIEGVATVVAELLLDPGQLRILATSRAPLEVRGEFVWPLQPLSVPDGCELLRSQAVASGADTSLAPEDLVELVTRVDAIPLGLELAATRLRSLNPSEVIESIDEGLAGLRSRRRGQSVQSQRHDSLADAIEWSYRLLDANEALALRRLAFMPGVFDFDRAHAVVGSTTRVATADLLDRLVSQSMLSATRTDGRLTYRLLETIRQFALERLEEADEFVDSRRQYIDHVVEAAADLVRRAVERWSDDVVNDTLRLSPDLLVAPRVSMEAGDDAEVTLGMFLPAWGLVHEHHAGQVAALGRELLNHFPSTSMGWGDVAAITATALMRLSRTEEATQVARASLNAAGIINEPVARRVIAMADQHQGRFYEALDHVRLARSNAAALGLAPFEAELLVFEATLLGQLGRLDEAIQVASKAESQNRELESTPVATWSRVLHAYLAAHRDPDRSLDLVRAVEEEIDPDRVQWIVARHLGILAFGGGDRVAAARWLRHALSTAREAGEVPHAWVTLRWIAVLAATAEPMPFSGALALLEVVDGNPNTPAPGALDLDLLERARSMSESSDGLRAAPLDRADDGWPFRIAEELLGRLSEHGSSTESVDSGSKTQIATFIRRGDVWTIGWDSESIEVSHSKGLADLARLLAEPGVDIHALELMGALAEENSIEDGLDHTARRQLEARLRDVQIELESAEAQNDLGRIASSQAEFDQIVDALSAGLGLGGTTRTTGGSAEKARSAVRWRIRAAIKKMEPQVPRLARHLDASVKTGIWCSYRPELPVVWTTQLSESR